MASLEAQLREKDELIRKLKGSLEHWRSWAVKLAARYASYSPDVARPARRIYVGGLPATTAEVSALREFWPCREAAAMLCPCHHLHGSHASNARRLSAMHVAALHGALLIMTWLHVWRLLDALEALLSIDMHETDMVGALGCRVTCGSS